MHTAVKYSAFRTEVRLKRLRWKMMYMCFTCVFSKSFSIMPFSLFNCTFSCDSVSFISESIIENLHLGMRLK